MVEDGIKMYKTFMRHRYLIIMALTALCIIGCENGKRNASESNDEDLQFNLKHYGKSGKSDNTYVF